MPKGKIEGILVALLTPLDERGNINEESLRELVKFLVDKGVHGFYPCGTTGEAPLLKVSERKRISEIVVDEAPSNTKVIVHVGTLIFDDIIELAKHAVDVGADAVAAVTPYYYKFDDEAVYNFYSKIAVEVDTDIFLYNIPPLTSTWLNIDIISRLTDEFSNIVGIKDSSGDFIYLLKLLRDLKGKLDVLVGSENLLLPALNFTAVGGVSGLANAFPELVIQLYSEFRRGNIEEALKLQFKLIKISSIVDGTNYSAKLKTILEHRGVKVGEHVKMPLRTLRNIEKVQLINELKTEGLL